MRRATHIFLSVSLIALGAGWLGASSANAAFGFSSSPDLAFTDHLGSPSMQAGSHPEDMTTSFEFNTLVDPVLGEIPDGAAKDLIIELPPGQVANTTAMRTCPSSIFLLSPELSAPDCPEDTIVGTMAFVIGNANGKQAGLVPLENLQPSPGSVLKFGFFAANVPVIIEVGLNNQPPYNGVVKVSNIPQVVSYFSSKATIWGYPASHSHDAERGTCLESVAEDLCPIDLAPKPFLTLPTSCSGPLHAMVEIDSWENPGAWLGYPIETHDASSLSVPIGMTGCDELGFKPTITAQPTSKAAQSPTGLDFSLDVADEGLDNPRGRSQSDIRKVEVTLPEGFSTNPSLAEGLNVCSEADLARETVNSPPGAGCPSESKIGTVEVESPLLDENVNGSLFIAKPYENEVGSLIALYVVIKNPALGIIVKQALKVENDPRTGQITTVAEELPQLPFSHFRLHFREGTRSPLATPPLCGEYAAKAILTPWSGTAAIETNSLFSIISGPGDSVCPSGGAPPFHPGLGAGTINNSAGSYSPFNVQLSRTDSEQEITHFSIKLPPGVTGKLAGIPFCGNADIAAAKAREGTEHGGQEELEHPSCPQASEIGHTLTGAGVGPSLTYIPGKVYLSGPYKGSNLSIVAITAAKAGPFDLGTVVIREGLKVSPETAEVAVDAAGSDPIPHIVNGIPVHLRDIRVYVDRPEFVLNPTSCNPTSTASTVLGSGTNFASEADDRPVTVTSRFQAADCASLAFKPRLKLSLNGPTKRAGLPRLKAVVTPSPGEANIGKAVVTLPPSEFLEQGHIGTTCTRVQFNEGGGNGEHCPEKSIYGHAVAITPLLSEPLEGSVYLRSNGGERVLPDLVAALHSADINIDLVGFINSLHKKGSEVSQIRTTFANVPDQPVTRFTLEMFGGKKGLLINSTNLCKGTHRAISEFTGQNGRRYDTKPAVKAQCKKKGKDRKKSEGHKGAKGKGGARVLPVLLRLAGW